MIRAVILDLDDTLYPERDYVRSGFTHVARHFARSAGEADALFAFLWDHFERGARGDLFDRLLAAYPRPDAPTVAELVMLYRQHAPALSLSPEVAVLLDGLKTQGTRLGLISDGPLASQSAKVEALALGRWMDVVVLTDAWGRHYWKPHPRAFEHVARSLGLPPEQLLYVADNPEKDFVAPRRLGWETVRLRLPGQLRCDACPPTGTHAAAREVTSLAMLRDLLFDRCGPEAP